jgi:2-polyprenyl-6-methoxyphenol hydroxylase-like FAD-dependent oxidoreductase
MTYDFLIVGGGVAGGVLAGLLGRGGKKVLLLEKSVAPSPIVRPEIVWPHTVRVFESLIPGDQLADTVLPLGSVEVWPGDDPLLVLSDDFLGRAGVERCSLEPNLLREQLLGAGEFELRRGVEVNGLLEDNGRVVGVRARDLATSREHDFMARYTIGNDGVRSFVRDECGIRMRTRIFPLDLLCFGFDWPESIPRLTTRVWLNTGALDSGIIAMFALPLPNGKGAGMIAVRPWIFDKADLTERAWRGFSAIDGAITGVMNGKRFPADLARIRRPWGHAGRYSHPGVVLMGDAAHPVSPVGGQGTNMAVADAAVFAELALAGVPDLAAEYERQRMPANTRSLRFTRHAARLLGLPGFLLPGFGVNFVFRWLRRNPATLVDTILYASTAFQGRTKALPSAGPAT